MLLPHQGPAVNDSPSAYIQNACACQHSSWLVRGIYCQASKLLFCIHYFTFLFLQCSRSVAHQKWIDSVTALHGRADEHAVSSFKRKGHDCSPTPCAGTFANLVWKLLKSTAKIQRQVHSMTPPRNQPRYLKISVQLSSSDSSDHGQFPAET